MKTIRTRVFPSHGDLERLGRLMINVRADARQFEWAGARDAKSPRDRTAPFGFNSISVAAQPGVAPFTFNASPQRASSSFLCALVVGDDLFGRPLFDTLLRTLSEVLANLSGVSQLYCSRDLGSIRSKNGVWVVRTVSQLNSEPVLRGVLVDSGGFLSGFIGGRETVTAADLFGGWRLLLAPNQEGVRGFIWCKDTSTICFPDNPQLHVRPVQLCRNLTGFIVDPGRHTEALLPGCVRDFNPRLRNQTLTWSTWVPMRAICARSDLAEMPLWDGSRPA